MTKKYLGALIGNIMQFYDFTIYAFLTKEISECFFNFENQFMAYFVALSIFATGYITRPVGALLFGYFGDKKGRSWALSKTIIISTLTTFLIGITPGYQSIGMIAPISLVILRLLQGLSVSGEEGGAVVLLFENTRFQRRGLLGAAVLASVLLGVVLGIFVCSTTNLLISHGLIGEWGWRIPFLISLPLGILAIFLRFYLNDFKLFERAKENNVLVAKPCWTLFRNYLWPIIFGITLVAIYSITTSTLIVHLPYYLTEKLHFLREDSQFIVGAAILFVVLLTLVIGHYCDRWDAWRIYYGGSIGTLIFSPILFWMMAQNNVGLIMIAILIFCCLISLISAALFSILVGLFPFSVRYSGVSLAFNLCITIFSSTTPLILIIIEKSVSNVFLPGVYISGVSALNLMVMNILSRKITVSDFSQHKHEELLYRATQSY